MKGILGRRKDSLENWILGSYLISTTMEIHPLSVPQFPQCNTRGWIS